MQAIRNYKFNQGKVKIIGSGAEKEIVLTVVNCITYGTKEKSRKSEDEKSLEKTKQNLSRARSEIYEIAMCNEWDYFFTGTINGNWHDRYNLSTFYKKFHTYVRNLRRKGYDIKYLFVPEMHKDGAWHLHGLIKGLPESELHRFVLGDTMSAHIAQKVKKGCAIYSWIGYDKRFGFCDLEKVRSRRACSRYITTYLKKDLYESKMALGAHLYYCSQGLSRGEVVARGDFDRFIEYDLQVWKESEQSQGRSVYDAQIGEYCRKLTFDYSPELEAYLSSAFNGSRFEKDDEGVYILSPKFKMARTSAISH